MFRHIYIHIPFCSRKCPYCSFVSMESNGLDRDEYCRLLQAEMRLAAAERPAPERVDTIYIGGGTPSLLSPVQIGRLLATARELFPVGQDAEVTLEVNPGTVAGAALAGFAAAGLNRLSIGVQSFSRANLLFLGRIHTADQAVAAFGAAREAGFTNIGIDLIHGLPDQRLLDWRYDLERGVALGPEHISVYGLTIEEGTPFAARFPEGLPVGDDLGAEMFELAHRLLTDAGYEHYEIANYARPGHRSRHNSGYWRRSGYLGLGVAAHSFMDAGHGIRFSNAATLDDYAGAIGKGELPRRDRTNLTAEDAMAEYFFLGLRMADGISGEEFQRLFGRRLTDLYSQELERLRLAGLLEWTGDRLRLTLKGMLLSNQVFIQFLS